MLQITESAEQKIASLIEQNDQPIAGLRVAAQARSRAGPGRCLLP